MLKIKPVLFCLLVLMSFRCFAQNSSESINGIPQRSKKSQSKVEKKLLDSILKNIPIVPGRAIVYIVRPSSMAFAIPMRLDCDSFQVGWIAAKTFLYTILDSGDHVFKARSENNFHLNVHLEAGKIYYIHQVAKMGILYARTKLILLDDEQGLKYLNKCTISGHNQYPQFPNSKDVENSPPPDL